MRPRARTPSSTRAARRSWSAAWPRSSSARRSGSRRRRLQPRVRLRRTCSGSAAPIRGVLFALGRWSEAEQELTVAVQTTRAAEPVVHAEALTQLARAAARAGPRRRGRAAARGTGDAGRARAGRPTARGEPGAAAALLRRSLRTLEGLARAPLLDLLPRPRGHRAAARSPGRRRRDAPPARRTAARATERAGSGGRAVAAASRRAGGRPTTSRATSRRRAGRGRGRARRAPARGAAPPATRSRFAARPPRGKDPGARGNGVPRPHLYLDKVIVVGAGPAGLATAAQLRRADVPAVVLEQADAIAPAWRGRYDRLRAELAALVLAAPRRPGVPAGTTFPSRDELVAYLDAYARAPRARRAPRRRVERIEREGDRWRLRDLRGRAARRARGRRRRLRAPPVHPGVGGPRALPRRAPARRRLPRAGALRRPGRARRRARAAPAPRSPTTWPRAARARVRLAVRTPPNIIVRDPIGAPLATLFLKLPPRSATP